MIVKQVSFDNGTGRDASSASQVGSSMWWNRKLPKEHDDAKCEQVHGEVVPYVISLMSAWSTMDWFDRCHDRMYENRVGLRNPKGMAVLGAAGFGASRLGVVPSIIDTFCSRFEKRRPMPMIVVEEADYTLKQQAAEFQALVRGKMREKDVDHVSAGVLKHSGIRGNGIAYIDEDEDDITVERVHRWELLIDPHESKGGEQAVRQIHRVRRMAREVLIARYPEYRQAITDCPKAAPRKHESGDDFTAPSSSSHEGLVDVYESWHLPSAPWDEDDEECCDDGRKSICIEGATLYFGRWTRPRFPFAILRRYERPDSFWGQGTAERLADAAHDINKMIAAVQRNADVNSNLIVFRNMSVDSKVPTEKLTGRGPMVIDHFGSQPPVFKLPDAVSPSQLGYLEKRIAWCHDFEGVSQWSAQGRSPLGAGASGVAIDTMEDLQSDRHATFEAAYARWRCEVAQLIIDACRAVAKRLKEREAEGGKRRKKRAAWDERGTLRSLDWDTVAMDDERYRIQIEPSGFMPTTRAGKLAATKELSSLGIWSPEQMMELYDEPDLAGASREALAKIKNARRVMKILSDPKIEAPMPEPQWGLELHAKMAEDHYCLSLIDNAPEQVQARYRDYGDACQDMIERGKKPPVNVEAPTDPAAAMPMGAPPGMPPGMPPMDPGAMPPDMGAPPMPPMPVAA